MGDTPDPSSGGYEFFGVLLASLLIIVPGAAVGLLLHFLFS